MNYFFKKVVKLLILSLSTAFWLVGCEILGEDSSSVAGSSKEASSNTPEATKPKLHPLVLFIGNSLTYNHDIPGKFNNLLDSNRLEVEGYSKAQMDAAGSRHLSNLMSPAAKALFHGKRPKFLVLQEQSAGWRDFNNITTEAVRRFQSIASEIGATTILYQTWNKSTNTCDWSHKNGWDSIPEKLLRKARETGIAVAPVAQTWAIACRKSLSVPLTPTDDYHAAAAGAYAAAYTFVYTLLPNQPKIQPISDAQIPTADMQKLNDAAYEAVQAQPQTQFIPSVPRVQDEIGGTAETAKKIVNLSNHQIQFYLEACDVDSFFIEPTDTVQKIEISGGTEDKPFAIPADGSYLKNYNYDFRRKIQTFDTSITQRIYLIGISRYCGTSRTEFFQVKINTL